MAQQQNQDLTSPSTFMTSSSTACYSDCTITNCDQCEPISTPLCTQCNSTGYCLNNTYSTDAQNYIGQRFKVRMAHEAKYWVTDKFKSGQPLKAQYSAQSIGDVFTFQLPKDTSQFTTSSVFIKRESNQTNDEPQYIFCPYCNALTSYSCYASRYDLFSTDYDFTWYIVPGLTGIGFSLIYSGCSSYYLVLKSNNQLELSDTINTQSDRESATFLIERESSAYVKCLSCSYGYLLTNSGFTGPQCQKCSGKSQFTQGKILQASCDESQYFCNQCLYSPSTSYNFKINSLSCCDYSSTVTNAYTGKEVFMYPSSALSSDYLLTANTQTLTFELQFKSLVNNRFILQKPISFSSQTDFYQLSDNYVSIYFSSQQKYLTCISIPSNCTFYGAQYTQWQIFKVVSLDSKRGIAFQSVQNTMYYLTLDAQTNTLQMVKTDISQISNINATAQASWKLRKSGCKPGETQASYQSCQCQNTDIRISESANTNPILKCSDLMPFCSGCGSDLICCQANINFDSTIENIVVSFKGFETVSQDKRLQVNEKTGYLDYQNYYGDNFDSSYFFTFETQESSSTDNGLQPYLTIKSESKKGWLYCPAYLDSYTLQKYGNQCYFTKQQQKATKFIIANGLYDKNQGISLARYDKQDCYLAWDSKGKANLDCYESFDYSQKTWKVMTRQQTQSTINFHSYATKYVPQFYFDANEKDFPIQIDAIQLASQIKTYTNKFGEVFEYSDVNPQYQQTTLDKTAPVYYNLRKDKYHTYIIYSLVFSKHNCSGFNMILRMSYNEYETDLFFDMCPLFDRQIDIEFVTLKFTEGGTFKSAKLSGSFSLLRKQYSAKELTFNNKSQVIIYVNKGTHSLYPQPDQLYLPYAFLDYKECYGSSFLKSCLGFQGGFGEYIKDASIPSNFIVFSPTNLKYAGKKDELTEMEDYVLNSFKGKLGGRSFLSRAATTQVLQNTSNTKDASLEVVTTLKDQVQQVAENSQLQDQMQLTVEDLAALLFDRLYNYLTGFLPGLNWMLDETGLDDVIKKWAAEYSVNIIEPVFQKAQSEMLQLLNDDSDDDSIDFSSGRRLQSLESGAQESSADKLVIVGGRRLQQQEAAIDLQMQYLKSRQDPVLTEGPDGFLSGVGAYFWNVTYSYQSANSNQTSVKSNQTSTIKNQSDNQNGNGTSIYDGLNKNQTNQSAQENNSQNNTNNQSRSGENGTYDNSSLTKADIIALGYECITNDDCLSLEKSQCKSYMCQPCESDYHCSQFGPGINGCSNGQCVQCTQQYDCGTSWFPQCSNNQCAGCTQDSHCSRFSGTPYCDVDYGDCTSTPVICYATTDCTNPKAARCNMQTSRCESCESDSDCSSIPGKGYCYSGECITQCESEYACGSALVCTNGKCAYECMADSDCASNPDGKTSCNLETNKCAECTSIRGCMDEQRPICDLTFLYCKPCSYDFQCALRYYFRSNCNADTGKCERCSKDRHCPSSDYQCVKNECILKKITNTNNKLLAQIANIDETQDLSKNVTDSSSWSCLSLDSDIQIGLDGATKKLRDLKRGDKIVSFDFSTNTLIEDEIKAMIHRSEDTLTRAFQITLSNQRSLVLTGEHTIITKNRDGLLEYKLAQEVVIGDTMLSNEDGFIYEFGVSSIKEVIIEGFAAPLTGQGNLVSDGVLVSCYAKIKSQALGDFAMWPLKTFKWIQDYEDGSAGSSIHPYADWVYYLASMTPSFIQQYLFE